MSEHLQENGMMLLELKQSCANSLCIHISGKSIDPNMDNDPFRNIFIKYLMLQIKVLLSVLSTVLKFLSLKFLGPSSC